MIDKKKAVEIAENYVTNQQNLMIDGTELELIKEAVITKPYGWVFVYDSSKFIETNDFSYAIVGNAPFLVSPKNGAVTTFGTAHDIDYYLKEYEQKLLF
jgi:Immunity protein 35